MLDISISLVILAQCFCFWGFWMKVQAPDASACGDRDVVALTADSEETRASYVSIRFRSSSIELVVTVTVRKSCQVVKIDFR